MAITRKTKTEVATTEQPVVPTATVSTENEATKKTDEINKSETPKEAEATTETETPKEAEATTETETPKEEEANIPSDGTATAKNGDEEVTSETERNNSSGETAIISRVEEETSQPPVAPTASVKVNNKPVAEPTPLVSPVAPVAVITPPDNCGVDNQLPVSTEEAIREVQNKIAKLKETREQNLNVSSIVTAVDKEIKDLEIMLSELNKKIKNSSQQDTSKKEVNSNMSNIDNSAITHKSILNAQIVKTLLNSQSSEPLSVTEETCQLMYEGRELSRTYNNFISACSRLLPNFSMESYKGNHVLINNETFSIYRIQRETLNIINNGIVNIYNDNNERILNDIEIEFIRATSEGAIEIYKEVDVHGNISEYALRRNINR